MALVVTPTSDNGARIECTDCPSVLVVTGIPALLVARMAEAVEAEHVHRAA